MELLEAENLCLVPRRRGPKPLSVRAKFAATAWLDGDILWREGRVVWRVDEREIAIGPRELEAVSRALSSLKRHEKTAKRHCADFETWHARRVGQWRTARQLAAIRAPDLESLVSPSRRRNPAALDRLAQLLAVEASVAEPLPVSPARALFEAWPLSQNPLRALLRDENQLSQTRALAALVIGAAQPLEALPGEPFLRRAARYGARFGFPSAPQLVVALLQNGERDAENSILRIEKSLENRAPFGFDVSELMRVQRAGRNAASVADLAEAAGRLPVPFSAISFAPVAPKRFDLGAQRAISQAWSEIRAVSHAAFRDVLAHVARGGDAASLELASRLLRHLISTPIEALGPMKIERGRTPRRAERAVLAFEIGVRNAVTLALNILRKVADSPDPGAVLRLLIDALPKCSVCPGCPDMSPAMWAATWHAYAGEQERRVFAPLLKLARKSGVATAREALRLDCWRALARQRQLPPEMMPFALEIVAWAPACADDIIYYFSQWQRHWNGVEGAQIAFGPITSALGDAPADERALWLDEITNEIEDSRRGVRGDLPALARFLPAMRRAKTGSEVPRWALVETALALHRASPEAEKTVDSTGCVARFEWLSGEMARRWDADNAEPSWSNLSDCAALCAQLAGADEPKFRQLMATAWRYAGYNNDFEWFSVRRGAKLARALPHFQRALADNLVRCPARCFAVLEKLGPLDQFESLRAPLKPRCEVGPLRDFCDFGVDIPVDLQLLATRFIAAKRELQETEELPPGIRKIAAWPQKMKAEVAALQRCENPSPSQEKRLGNLVARLENPEALCASMMQEMGESLRNAVVEAELRVMEAAVENCYRVRLESLGAPQNLILNADLLNAALFSTDIESNRKWLRQIVRAHCQAPDEAEPNSDWRLEIAGNARFLKSLSERGLEREVWLSPAPRTFVVGGARFELRLENDPLKILQMGNYFDTCLSRGGCNAFSSVANAVELNKRVVFARDAKNRVVGRQLLALSGDDKLLGFRVYASVGEEIAAELRRAFGSYARDFAARCGVELGDKGEVERLFVSDWYDDGSVEWGDLGPVEVQAKPIKPSKRRLNEKEEKRGRPNRSHRQRRVDRQVKRR